MPAATIAAKERTASLMQKQKGIDSDEIGQLCQPQQKLPTTTTPWERRSSSSSHSLQQQKKWHRTNTDCTDEDSCSTMLPPSTDERNINNNTGESWSNFYKFLTPPRLSRRRRRDVSLDESSSRPMAYITMKTPALTSATLPELSLSLHGSSQHTAATSRTTYNNHNWSNKKCSGYEYSRNINSYERIATAAEETTLSHTNLFRRIRTRRERRRQELEHRRQNLTYLRELPGPPPVWRCIPAEHPLKLAWDVGTVLLSILNAYVTHIALRDRDFQAYRTLRFIIELWFALDILLNFGTEHKIGSVVLKTVPQVSARYLTTWFLVDVISLIPGELLWVQPILHQQKTRTRLQTWLRRSRAVRTVSKYVRNRWSTVRTVSVVCTKRAGVRATQRLVRLGIRYIPKYVLFVKHMKAVVVVRALRQVHWWRKVYRGSFVTATSTASSSVVDKDNETYSTVGFDAGTLEDDGLDDLYVDYDDFEDDDLLDEYHNGVVLFDDGAPYEQQQHQQRHGDDADDHGDDDDTFGMY